MTQYTFIQGADSITVYVGGNAYTAQSSHVNYDKIIDGIKTGGDEQTMIELFDTASAIRKFCGGKVDIIGGVLRYEGVEVTNSLSLKILRMMEEGFDIDPMVNFFQRLKLNPSRTAQQELYDFLEAGDLPITPDGHFLAYKSVNNNYMDIHSGKFDNSIGQICEMPRGDVCDDRTRTCASGLHFAQKSYAEGFGGSTSHLMVLKVDPANVVSIPMDYNNTKGRCSKYEVIGEVAHDLADDEYGKTAVYDD